MPFGLLNTFVCICIFAIVVKAQGRFIFPFSSLAQIDPSIQSTFAVGSSINIQWETTAPSTNLVIFQSGPNPLQALPRSGKSPEHQDAQCVSNSPRRASFRNQKLQLDD